MDPTEVGNAVDQTGATTNGRVPDNPFHVIHTWMYAVAWAFVMLQGWGAYIGSNPTALLYYPVETSARVVNRDLEIATANERAGRRNPILDSLQDSLPVTIERAIWIQRDVLSVLTSPDEDGGPALATSEQLDAAHIRLAILLAEASNHEEARAAIAEIHDPTLRIAMDALIPDTAVERAPEVHSPSVETLELLATAGIEEWILDRAAIRLLNQASDVEASRLAIKEIRDAPHAHRANIRNALTIADTALVVVGALLLVPFVLSMRRRGTGETFAPPWSASTGWAVMVRADFWNRLYFVILADLAVRLDDPDWLHVFHSWGSVIASLPMLWLIYRHLVGGSVKGFVEAFGLRVKLAGAPRLIATTFNTIAINFVGIFAVGWFFYWLGTAGTWSEGLNENFYWGTTSDVIDACIDYLVLTPTFEELMFRGLLYFTLRRRYGAIDAASLSALLFALIHFYSAPGFVMTFWSGFIWAFAFERARSLWPGIFAHSIYNLFFVAGTLLIYR